MAEIKIITVRLFRSDKGLTLSWIHEAGNEPYLSISTNHTLTTVEYGMVLRFLSEHAGYQFMVTTTGDETLDDLITGFIGLPVIKPEPVVKIAKEEKVREKVQEKPRTSSRCDKIARDLRRFVRKNKLAMPDFQNRGLKNIGKLTNYINSSLALEDSINDDETLLILEIFDTL